MKKILSLSLALSLAMLAGCSSQPAPNTESAKPSESAQVVESSKPVENNESNSAAEGPVALDFNSEVTAMEGEWVLSQVYAEGNTTDAAADAMSLKITMELDPSELVDEAAYIHNQVYNLTGYLTFGMDEIVQTLAADEVEEYKGSTSWADFPQGEVVSDGDFFKQPGPATMRFKDVDDYGLFLDKVAGVSADLDTTEKTLIIGMNGDGQLLLGASEEHLERPGTEGDWTYCMIFNKAA
nr:hypothetical protein [uncultured Flavonifractor sp.]